MSRFITEPNVVTAIEVVAKHEIPNGVVNMVHVSVSNLATGVTSNLADEMIKRRYGFPMSRSGEREGDTDRLLRYQ